MRSFVVFVGVLGALLAPAVASPAPTIVSLTFDDGTENQDSARPILVENGMRGTFYVNTNKLGISPFFTWAQLSALAGNGNEIAGHTLDHVNLTSVTSAEATRQICDDRQALLAGGFAAVSFAYPYGASNASIESIVQGCGYRSARRAWGLCNIGLMPPNCNDVVAETIPPRNRWAIATAGVRAFHSLADLQSAVTRAEAGGGGWVPLMFHHVCDGCDPANGYSISPSLLSAFLSWLAPRTVSGTYVRTMSDVIGDATAPASSIACDGGGCSGWFTQPASVSLSATDSGTAVTAIRYTTDGSTPTTSSPPYTGPFTVATTTTVRYRAWDMVGNVEATKSQLIQVDSASPVSSITCNDSECSSATYGSPVSVALSATDTGGSGVAEIHYETNGSQPTLLSPRYFAPFTVSATTTVTYRAWDSAGNAEATRTRVIQISSTPSDTAPTSTIACNGGSCSAGWYAAPVSVSLSATDAEGSVSAIRYTTDESDPSASSTLYTGPFSISSTTTVKYRAWDNAGNLEATKSQLLQVDTVAPTVSITAPANGATLVGNVKIVAAATDAVSGVASVAFYVDGGLVGTASGSPWQIPWNARKATSGQHVLTAVARDRAGNSTTSAAVTVNVR